MCFGAILNVSHCAAQITGCLCFEILMCFETPSRDAHFQKTNALSPCYP